METQIIKDVDNGVIDDLIYIILKFVKDKYNKNFTSLSEMDKWLIETEKKDEGIT